jgi:hypothetical protein
MKGQTMSTAENKPRNLTAEGYWGLCPQCDRSEYLTTGKDEWYFCPVHEVRWLVGGNLFSDWKHTDAATMRANWEKISHFAEVEARHVWQDSTPKPGWFGWIPWEEAKDGRCQAYIRRIEKGLIVVHVFGLTRMEIVAIPEDFTPDPTALFWEGSGPGSNEECEREVERLRQQMLAEGWDERSARQLM